MNLVGASPRPFNVKLVGASPRPFNVKLVGASPRPFNVKLVGASLSILSLGNLWALFCPFFLWETSLFIIWETCERFSVHSMGNL